MLLFADHILRSLICKCCIAKRVAVNSNIVTRQQVDSGRKEYAVYQIGDKVVCGNKGVCRIEDITELNISGVDKERQYYILKPLYMAASTVYVPVDTAEKSLRNVMTSEEAKTLLHRIPELPLVEVSNDKFLEQAYKECLKTDDCAQWIRIIKTISVREKKRQAAGRKITSVDSRYNKIAQDCVFGELAVVLGMSKEAVEEYIEEVLA